MLLRRRRQLPLQVAQLALQPARARRAVLKRSVRRRGMRVERGLQPRGRLERARRPLGHLLELCARRLGLHGLVHRLHGRRELLC